MLHVPRRIEAGPFLSVNPIEQAWSQTHSGFGSRLVALAPPYRTWTERRVLDAADVPLGSVVLGSGAITIAVLAELTALSSRYPWAVPILALPAHQEPIEPLLMRVTELRDRLVVLSSSIGGRGHEAATVVACVRRRAPPTGHVLARWVARRLQVRELEIPLRAQFGAGLEEPPAATDISVSSYSRLFAHYGSYTARDWRAIARLCGHAQRGATSGAAAGGTLTSRTATDHAKRYLGISCHVMAERVGWEWVLEAALRTGHYT